MKTVNEQVNIIRQIIIDSHLDTCDTCGLSGVFMYKKHDAPLCPECDHDIIEKHLNKWGNMNTSFKLILVLFALIAIISAGNGNTKTYEEYNNIYERGLKWN